MKIKSKMMLLFFMSICLSVIIFLFSTYYLLHSGYFSGISASDMQQAVSDTAEALNISRDAKFDKKEILRQLEAIEQSYDKMQFAVLTGQEWVSRGPLPVIHNSGELIQAVQKNLGHYKIAAKSIKGTSNYVICYVNKDDYEAMSYSFNMIRADGILGKIGILGTMITLFITGGILYLFTRKEMKRFKQMQEILTAFALEHTEVRMNVSGKDELSVMASNFNSMADKIAQQYQEKLQYNQSRQELVANLSHDLRTPLSSVIGYSEMLRDEIYETKEEEKRYIDIIHRKAEYMEYLLTELLEYSRLELGKLVLERTHLNLAELIREILIEYYPIIEKNGFELEIHLPESGVYGEWDKNRMGRVLRNLIDNALKYGMDGKKLRISLEQNNQQIVLEIQDYGIGMKKEEAEHIFEMFYRADGARNSRRGGMGLGMYISQEIIRLHGGKIDVISEYQKGTTVRIELERKKSRSHQ